MKQRFLVTIEDPDHVDAQSVREAILNGSRAIPDCITVSAMGAHPIGAPSARLASNTCVLCGEDYGEYGNNPHPLAYIGRACDSCDATKVIPERLNKFFANSRMSDEVTDA